MSEDWTLPQPQTEQRDDRGLAVIDERAAEIREMTGAGLLGVASLPGAQRSTTGLVIEPDDDCDACQ